MTSNTEFRIINNGIDININIIQHIPTGYYNITKINNIIYEEQLKENEPGGIPPGSKKEVKRWFYNKSNQEYIDFLKTQEQINDLKHIINESNDEFKGTYVHELLYDQILMWIDKTYAYKVSKILKSFRNEYNNKLENENIELKEDNIKKTCKIDDLNKKFDKYAEESKKQAEESKKRDEEQKKQIEELLKFAKNTKEQNNDLNDNIKEVRDEVEDLKEEVKETAEKVEEVREEFKKQREHINPPPGNDENIHMLVLLQYPEENNKLRIIRGQNKHLDKKITQDMNIIIDKKYHPNPIDAFTILKEDIKKLNSTAKDKIRSDFKNKTISREEKNELLEDHRMFPSITIKYNTIILNYKKISLNEFIELVNKCTDLGKETYIP